MGRAIYGFHRGVGEERHFVNGINFLHGTCMCLVEVAVAANDGSRLGSEAQHFFTQAGGAFGGGRRLIPFDLEKFSRLHGGPGRIGDNSHASAGVIAAAGPGGLSELMRQMGGLHFEHRADMGSRVHFVSVEMARRAAVNRAAYHGGNEHSGKPSVQAEFGGASYFGERICAAGRLADKLEVRRILQRRIIWRRNPGCKRDKLSVKKSFLRRQMDDRAVFRTARGALHIPFPRGCGNQHFASGGPGFAQIVIRSANAQASSRKLVAILRIEVGLDNLDAAPIAGKFLRDNHGQRRANALSDLGLAAPDLHSAVLRNFEPSVWQKGARRIG